jgi:hypothetical protein
MITERVELTQAEMLACVSAGAARTLRALMRKDGQRDGANLPRWQIDIEAACAEFAVAKLLGLFPSGFTTDRGSDVGTYQVRWSSQHSHRLPLRTADDPSDIFIFVTGEYGHYVVNGWCLGAEGMHDEFWTQADKKRPNYCWMVPKSELRPISELMAIDGSLSG